MNALYYPFSNVLDIASLKQMLLTFDKLYFLDPVDDIQWRSHLYQNLANNVNPDFKRYETIDNNLSLLIKEGAVHKISPSTVSTAINSDITAQSVLSDLLDDNWVNLARRTMDFNLPTEFDESSNRAAWQIFQSKIPLPLLDRLASDTLTSSHLIREGDAQYAWKFSYEAGSSIAINSHLAVAEHLGLAPLTDSDLHQRLMQQKLLRYKRKGISLRQDSPLLQELIQKVSISLLERIVPRSVLEAMSIEDIIEFRANTAGARHQAMRVIADRFAGLKIQAMDNSDIEDTVWKVVVQIEKEIRDYKADMNFASARIWPSLASSITTGAPAFSALAVMGTYIGSPGGVMVASAAAIGSSWLKAALEQGFEERRLSQKADSCVAYYSRIAEL